MQYKEINKIFSEAVAKTLANGFTICTNTMSGTQGEIAFVNFIDDNGDHYSLMLDKEIGRWEENGIGLDRYVISWVRSTDLKGYPQRTNVTFWRGDKHVEVISQRIFYIVSDRYFVEDAAEAKRIWEARRKHYRSGSDDDTYRFEFEMPMNGASRKLAAKLYREHKARYQKLKISAADINSVKVRRFNHGTRHIEIHTANEKVDFDVNISVKG